MIEVVGRSKKTSVGRINWFRDRFLPRSSAVEKACIVCGRSIWLPKSKVDRYTTCGNECANKRREILRKASGRNCVTCGALFFPRTTQIKAGVGKFCSQACNSSGLAAISAPGVRQRSVVKWKANRLAKDFIVKGENHPKWKGGRKATYERWKRNGGVRDQNNKRRCYRRQSIPAGYLKKLEALQRMRCATCRKSIRAAYHMDHIVPISKGGVHEKENIQLLCPDCNLRKSAKTPAQWASLNGLLI